jgi:Gas vesicle synthesis protein GvpO
MADRRQTRRTTQVASRRRRPDRDEPDVFDEDEAAEDDEQQTFDEDDPELDDEALPDEDEALPDEDEALPDEDEALPDEDESRPSRVRKSPPDGRSGRRPGRRRKSAMTASDAAKAALSQVEGLTAKQPEGITGVESTDDGWVIGVEVVEDRRIPSSADILATYETTIDDQGELLSYRRVSRYSRGRGDNGKG